MDASLETKPALGSSHVEVGEQLRAVGRWLSYVWVLTKPGISVFIGLTAATGSLLAGEVAVLVPAYLFVAGFLASAGAAAFNQYYERDLDARMARTAARPLPSGLLSPATALWVSALLLLSGVSMAFALVGLASAGLLLAGALVYTVLYTVLSKRRTVWNVPIGGLCGAFAALSGSTANGHLSLEGIAFGVLLYAWSAPHFWALAIPRAGEYAGVGIPMLPVRVGNVRTTYAILGHALFLPLPALLLWQAAPAGAAAVALTGLLFVLLAVQLVREARRESDGERTRKAAFRVFFFSLAHLPIVYVGFWVNAGL